MILFQIRKIHGIVRLINLKIIKINKTIFLKKKDLHDIKEMTMKCTVDKAYITSFTCLVIQGKNNFLFTLNSTLNQSVIPLDNVFVNILTILN